MEDGILIHHGAIAGFPEYYVANNTASVFTTYLLH